MNSPLLNNIGSLTNEELIDVLISEKDYVPKAINYAKLEIEKRQIPRRVLDALFEERRLLLGEKMCRAKAELSMGEKLFCILFPPLYIVLMTISPFLGFILPRGKGMIAYREEGYKTKASQSVIYSVFGIILWITLLIFLFVV